MSNPKDKSDIILYYLFKAGYRKKEKGIPELNLEYASLEPFCSP